METDFAQISSIYNRQNILNDQNNLEWHFSRNHYSTIIVFHNSQCVKTLYLILRLCVCYWSSIRNQLYVMMFPIRIKRTSCDCPDYRPPCFINVSFRSQVKPSHRFPKKRSMFVLDFGIKSPFVSLKTSVAFNLYCCGQCTIRRT